MIKIVKKYRYLDEKGVLRYTVHRMSNKTFPVYRPNGEPGYGPRGPILYRLPELLETNSEYIIICEGEKDCDNVRKLEFTATTNVGGCKRKWEKSNNKYFKNHRVVVAQDNDKEGRKHAIDIANNLLGVAKSVRLLPVFEGEGSDISDWIRDGGNRQKLLRLINKQKPLTETVKRKKHTKKSKRSKHTKNTILKGSRNSVLLSEAGSLRHKGLGFEEIYILLLKQNKNCKPPLPNDEVKRIARNICKYPKGVSQLLNDRGNSQRFAEQYKGTIQYCWDWKKWLVYDGMRWNPDTGELAAIQAAKDIARSLYGEAADCEDREQSKEIAHWAHKSSSSFSIKAMLFQARSEPGIGIYANQLDQNIYLFNCLNGTIDLRTGILQPHNPEDNITKLAPVEYPAEVGEIAKVNPRMCRLWLRCLKQWMQEDKNQIDYLCRSAGYWLTGDMTSRVFPVFHGTGRNGKNTFLDTLTSMMGDYAGKAPETLLKLTQYDRHPTEIADLEGKRLIVASETKANMKLKTSLVKEVTGDRTIKARAMRQDFHEFKQTAKIVLMTQNLPRIDERTDAIWDRVHRLKWGYRILKGEQDTHLLDKLKAEWSGILAWAVHGCLKWQRDGILRPTEQIVIATKSYRKQENPVKEFLDECCKRKKGEFVTNTRLWEYYEWWIHDNRKHFEQISQKEFTICLKQLGYKQKRKYIKGKLNRVWIGLVL